MKKASAVSFIKTLCYTYTVSTGDQMQRQLFKTGNSTVLSLPKDMLDSLGLKNGENVSLELDKKNNRLIITPVEKSLVLGVDEDFAKQVNDFIEKYRPALEELAK